MTEIEDSSNHLKEKILSLYLDYNDLPMFIRNIDILFANKHTDDTFGETSRIFRLLQQNGPLTPEDLGRLQRALTTLIELD